MSRPSEKSFTVFCGPSSEAESARNVKDGHEESKSSGLTSQLIPKSSEVESLVTEICNTTSIAEFELKLDGFRLYVTRDIAGNSIPPSPPSPTPVSVNTTVDTPDSNGSVASPSLAITKSVPSSGGIQTLLDKAADEGLVILESPKVGYFRRSRTIKGKRAPPSCKEKQIVKEGQVLCYIEQLGGEIPIESDISGEVIKILRQDGDPVGYGDALIAILPSFPGIKKLQ
ncbi:Biotin carboxyl carrier protein of acetyl-CoA carboxylase [Melia azedarach]|nr:Biotin carboxyl carrier protein of acetyl-CoA carboxylase [Melia azedarach]